MEEITIEDVGMVPAGEAFTEAIVSLQEASATSWSPGTFQSPNTTPTVHPASGR